MISRLVSLTTACAIGALVLASPALADVKVGVVYSLSGPAASQGIALKNAVELAIPAEIGGEKVNVIVLDDASDPSVASRNARKLVEGDNVDIVIGPSTTPTAIAIAQITSAAKVVLMPTAPVKLGDGRDEWIFNVPPPPAKWMIPTITDMKKKGVKTVGFLGFSDAWGDINLSTLQAFAKDAGFEVVADERYARADTSVTGQVLRLVSKNPDAIFLGVSGSAGVLGNVAIVERGYKGPIYNSNGVFNKDFLSLGGAAIEGVHANIGAIAVAESLPDSEPRKAVALDFIAKYNAKYGEGVVDAVSGFGYDSGLLATQAIERALASAKPGTAEFRSAIATELRKLNQVPGVHSIYTFADPKWPWGVGDDAAFLVTVKDGKWILAN
ncbi:MAG TPA: ABC transporter substrate-binding protein [Rhizobiaceae bacterium]|nr:ABC transporter substrate-binding protein [Rhizobiaceae bacterium]